MKSEIVDLLDRYFAAIDERRFDADTMRGFFAADARVVRPNGVVTTGPADIGDSHARNMGHFRATQHVMTNLLVTADDGVQATFRANLIARHLWAEGEGDPAIPGDANHFLAGGVLTGRVVRNADGWRIAEIANAVIWREGVGFQQVLRNAAPPS